MKFYLVLALLGLASGGWATITTKEFASILAGHDDGAHGDRFMLCQKMPGQVSLSIRAFSLTNPRDFDFEHPPISGQATPLPKFQEQSELIYMDHGKKENCSVGVQDMSINFQQSRDWILTKGTPTTPVTSVNVPFQRFGRFCTLDNHQTCLPKSEGYFEENVPVGVLLHSGVDVSNYRKIIDTKSDPIMKGVHALPELEKDTFAIFKEMNVPQKLTLNSDPDTYGNIMLLDDQSELHWWKLAGVSSICSKIAGSTGELFNGKIDSSSVLHYYSEDMCGTATLVFDSEDTTTFGFKVLKFKFYPNMLDSSCSCAQGETCLPQGAVDISSCQRGMPYVLSLPHFHGADASYASAVSGLAAKPEQHESYFFIEPVTGMLVESSQKFQLNVKMARLSWDTVTPLPDSVVFPVYWYDKMYKLDDTHIQALKAMLNNPATPTTTTTAAPLPGGESPVPDLSEVEGKLKSISNQVHVLLIAVFVFLILAVFTISGLGIVHIHHSRKASAQAMAVASQSRRAEIPNFIMTTADTKTNLPA